MAVATETEDKTVWPSVINPPLSKRSSSMQRSNKASNNSARDSRGIMAEIIKEGEHAATIKGDHLP